ncbi:MAG: M23 family metallopeptidase [Smithellaceae bacterium]|nr:M23 family metallopeptidase [Smithellaceae bacterium]
MDKVRPYVITKRPKISLRTVIIAFLVIAVVGGGGWLLFHTCLDYTGPTVTFTGPRPLAVGYRKNVDIIVSDVQNGVRTATVSLTQDNKIHPLTVTVLPGKGKERRLSVFIDPFLLKLHDGPATLTVTSEDGALLNNKSTVAEQINIDSVPPQISILSATNNVNPGGTCMIPYRASEPIAESGVWVDNIYTAGQPVNVAGKSFYAVFFAVPIDLSSKQNRIRLVVRDSAGNESQTGVPVTVSNKKFRADKMQLDDNFLQQKMPEFQGLVPELRGKTLLDTFIYVNDRMRDDNFKQIQKICSKSEPRQLWQDNFLRMKNASPMAMFADRRTYTYKGAPAGVSVHTGVDLASVKNAPIEAANSGIVVYAGPMGIYGNAVIIDHGWGIFSLYAHMSSISTQKGQQVKKGDVIGVSGMTGLAAGDHLHFGMMVGGQFVNPQEWWDQHWITDNITGKLAAVF